MWSPTPAQSAQMGRLRGTGQRRTCLAAVARAAAAGSGSEAEVAEDWVEAAGSGGEAGSDSEEEGAAGSVVVATGLPAEEKEVAGGSGSGAKGWEGEGWAMAGEGAGSAKAGQEKAGPGGAETAGGAGRVETVETAPGQRRRPEQNPTCHFLPPSNQPRLPRLRRQRRIRWAAIRCR